MSEGGIAPHPSPGPGVQHSTSGSGTSDVTVYGAEARQSDTALPAQVTLRARVQPLNQALLVEQRVVGAQSAGRIIVALVVVAEVRLPHGRDVLVDMHLLA